MANIHPIGTGPVVMATGDHFVIQIPSFVNAHAAYFHKAA